MIQLIPIVVLHLPLLYTQLCIVTIQLQVKLITVRIFNQKLLLRNIILASLTTTIICFFTSCSKKAMFQTSTVVPAARGFVKVSKDNNKKKSVEKVN